MNNLISVSGRIGSGKDLVGSIIQYLVWQNELGNSIGYETTYKDYLRLKPGGYTGIYQIKKFADKLKGGCEYDFPDEFSVEEWETGERSYRDEIMPSLGISRRDFLLKRGDACRGIHADYFVNSLFADYKKKVIQTVKTFEEEPISKKAYRTKLGNFPNWIITDTRFPNELKAVKDRGGVTIRVERPISLRFPKLWGMFRSSNTIENTVSKFLFWMLGQGEEVRKLHETLNHPSETALNDAEFDFTIINDGGIEELKTKVKDILVEIKVINK